MVAKSHARSDAPPARDWHWQDNHTTRAWLPLIGLEGLGLLDLLLAYTDHRSGFADVTYDHLVDQTGLGRSKLARLLRILAAAELVVIHQEPVAHHGPSAVRNRYQVHRRALPTAEALDRLTALAAHDPVLARRLAAYAAPVQSHDGTGTSPTARLEPVPPDRLEPVPPRDGSQDSQDSDTESPAPLAQRLAPGLWRAILDAAGVAGDPYLGSCPPPVHSGDQLTLTLAATLPARYRLTLADLQRHARAILQRPVTLTSQERSS